MLLWPGMAVVECVAVGVPPQDGWMDVCLYIGMASLLPKLCSGMDKWAWGYGVGVMLVSWSLHE